MPDVHAGSALMLCTNYLATTIQSEVSLPECIQLRLPYRTSSEGTWLFYGALCCVCVMSSGLRLPETSSCSYLVAGSHVSVLVVDFMLDEIFLPWPLAFGFVLATCPLVACCEEAIAASCFEKSIGT
eukprot:4414595-Amphidinium_carterae.1